MKRMTEGALRALLGASVVALVLVVVLVSRSHLDAEARCGAGFVAQGPRCVGVPGPDLAAARVLVPRTSVLVGPSDWEGEGRVAPRALVAGPFLLDVLEATVGSYHCPTCVAPEAARFGEGDHARAVGGLSFDEARAYCKHRGGRVPTEAEWIVAAAGPRGTRYPWGDTGAVCRRAAWGLESGPCTRSATGPDTVGAHADGKTPGGVHDLAGNVGEWVVAEPPHVRGGSYRSALATELRIWARRDVPRDAHEPDVGVRCAYDAP